MMLAKYSAREISQAVRLLVNHDNFSVVGAESENPLVVMDDRGARAPSDKAILEQLSRPIMPTADDVRAEASRRMIKLTNAKDEHHLLIVISNHSREIIRLLRKGRNNWSEGEVARAQKLEEIDAAIELIRAASNSLEVLPRVPEDYRSDRYWQDRG